MVNLVEMEAAPGQGALEVLTSRINTQGGLQRAKVRAGKTMQIPNPRGEASRNIEEQCAR